MLITETKIIDYYSLHIDIRKMEVAGWAVRQMFQPWLHHTELPGNRVFVVFEREKN